MNIEKIIKDAVLACTTQVILVMPVDKFAQSKWLINIAQAADSAEYIKQRSIENDKFRSNKEYEH